MLPCHPSFHPCLVDLIHMLFGRQQSVCQFPVIGQQKQSFCILIQSAHRKNPVRDRLLHQIQHRLLAAVLRGRKHSRRFIHHQIDILLINRSRSAAEHLRPFLVNLQFRLFYNLSVYLHQSFFQQGLHLAPGTKTGLAQISVQPHHAFILHPEKYLLRRVPRISFPQPRG